MGGDPAMFARPKTTAAVCLDDVDGVRRAQQRLRVHDPIGLPANVVAVAMSKTEDGSHLRQLWFGALALCRRSGLCGEVGACRSSDCVG